MVNTALSKGSDFDTRFLAFGDDSHHNGILVFAYVIVPRPRTRRVLRQVKKLKDSFGFPKGLRIHCRTLFSGMKRQKMGLAHMERDVPMRLIHHVITLINQYDIFVRYGYSKEEQYKNLFEGKTTLALYNEEGAWVDHPVKGDPKGILGMLTQICWKVASDRSQGPLDTDCEIYASQDQTKVQFLGPQRRRADHWMQIFPDIKAPLMDAGDYSPLFELADVVAYTLSHSLHGAGAEPQFFEAAKRIKWWRATEFVTDPNLTANPPG